MFATLIGCGQRARVLSPDKMKDLYVDMFVADAWLRDNPSLRIKADTTLFFDPIFEKHKCTHKDFYTSWEYYTSHPDEYSDLIAEVIEELQVRHDIVKELYNQYNEAMNLFSSLPDYWSLDFDSDSMKFFGSIALWQPDSLFKRDSLSIADSLAVPDTLVQRDTILSVDSLKVIFNKKIKFPKDAEIGQIKPVPDEKIEVVLK